MMSRMLVAAVAAFLVSSAGTAPASAAGTSGSGHVAWGFVDYEPGLDLTPAHQSMSLRSGTVHSHLALACTDGGVGVVYDGDGVLSGTGMSTIAEDRAAGAGDVTVGVGGSGVATVAYPDGTYVGRGASLSASGTGGYVRTGNQLVMAVSLSGIEIEPDGGGPLPPIRCADASMVVTMTYVWPNFYYVVAPTRTAYFTASITIG